MPNRFSEIRCRCMILSIHRGRTHQHQQIVIKYWQRAINSPPIETVGAGNFLPESSPFAGRFLCKPVRCWASHRRAPAATTRRVPQIRTAPADTHERCSGLREWTGPIDLEQAFTEWIQWDDTQYRLSTGVSDPRSGRTAISQPQDSGHGCVTNGETTDDR